MRLNHRINAAGLSSPVARTFSEMLCQVAGAKGGLEGNEIALINKLLGKHFGPDTEAAPGTAARSFARAAVGTASEKATTASRDLNITPSERSARISTGKEYQPARYRAALSRANTRRCQPARF